MRLCLLSPYSYFPGHHWTMIHALGEALLKNGHNVSIITSRSLLESQRTTSIPTIETCLQPGLPGILARLASRLSHYGMGGHLDCLACLLQARKLTLRDSCDGVFMGDMKLSLLVASAFFLKPTLGYWAVTVPALAHSNSPLRHLARSLLAPISHRFSKSKKIWAITETPEMLSLWKTFFPDTTRHVPLAMPEPPSLPSKQQARTRLKLPPDSLILMIMGATRAEKDYATVISAIARSKNNSFLLVAGKQTEVDVSRLAKDHQLDRFHFLNTHLTEEEKHLCYAACDIVVLPYPKNYYRGSAVMMEACQHHRPVLAADTGTLQSFVRENHTGYLYPCENADALSEQINTLPDTLRHDHASLDSAMAATREKYSWGSLVNEYERIFAQPE